MTMEDEHIWVQDKSKGNVIAALVLEAGQVEGVTPRPGGIPPDELLALFEQRKLEEARYYLMLANHEKPTEKSWIFHFSSQDARRIVVSLINAIAADGDALALRLSVLLNEETE